jgi:peptidoglycan-N-acetylglucosamine deacetylase
LNLLGIDFEDWYHPELIQPHVTKIEKKPHVVKGIDKIIEWLRLNETSATFFMVGELLEFQPEILDKIIGGGHEIAFHTMYHTRIDSDNFEEQFEKEIQTFKKLTSGKSKGFRAPSLSLNQKSSWVIDSLERNNYEYDSSIIPAKTPLYGVPSAELKPYKISKKSINKNDPTGKIIEFPLLTTKLLGWRIPAAGGFFLRTLPLRFIENAIEKYANDKIDSVFYIHSWELTPEFMPRLPLPSFSKFVTYHNIEKAFPKMNKLIQKFEFTSFEKYLKSM